MKLMRLLLFAIIGCLILTVSAKADCIPPFTWSYAVSHLESTDGTYLDTSVTVSGSATMAPAYCWYQQGTPLHHPGVQNQIKDLKTGVIVGGWTYGPGQCVQCQMDQTNSQSVSLTTDTYEVTEDGNMTCDWGGLFWSPLATTWTVNEAITYTKNVGGSSGAWNIIAWCTDASSPPDFNATLALSRTNYPYFKGLSVCSRPAKSAKGTTWNCQPNPTPFAAGWITPDKQDCTNYDAGITALWP
jgi:hypothetical protein